MKYFKKYSKKVETKNRSSGVKFSFARFLAKTLVSVFLIFIIFPLLWMFSLSLKEPQHVRDAYAFIIPKVIKFDNYQRAIDWANKQVRIPLPVMYKNSIIVTFSSVIITIIIALLASYAFSRLKFRGRNTIYFIILIGMMIPVQGLLIPIFLINKNIGLLNNYFSLILPYIAFGLPLSIFIMRGFFTQIPQEIVESAKIDGATDFVVFSKIMVPLAKPAIATCVILLFLQNWNEFILALTLLINPNLYTITVGLSKLSGQYTFPWEIYSSLVWLTAIPIIIVFIIFQNWFIKGLTAGSIKG